LGFALSIVIIKLLPDFDVPIRRDRNCSGGGIISLL
jgi:hypothetical protein